MTAPAQSVLVVDDDPTSRAAVRTYLERDGYTVVEAADGRDVIGLIGEWRPGLIVLDVMLSGCDGFDLLREVRASSRVPVIVLTARGGEADRLLGLELGGDDYVVKPFSPRELAARVRSVLRRADGWSSVDTRSDAPSPTSTAVLEFGSLRIDLMAREVTVDCVPVALTATEFDLVAFLAAHPLQVFSRSQLMQAVWATGVADQNPARVTVHIGRLREKLASDVTHARWIGTVFGIGYRFEP